MKAGPRGILALTTFLALAGCDQPRLEDQRKYEAYEAAPGLANDASARWPPTGTVPRGAGRETVPDKPSVTMALLRRGQQQYEAVCTPCHSATGDGDGMVVRRGFPSPPSFHLERLREASDRHIYDVITDGYGIMYSYADRVAPKDRWAIASYIRALQLSQHADVAELPDDIRNRLEPVGEAE